MMALARSVAPLLPVFVPVVVTLSACGADGAASSTLDLTPVGEEGRQVALTRGCASCHGLNGEGGVGPAFVGLLGRTVQLDDADPIVADEAYIVESIVDPNAKRVDGYSLPMPDVNLSDDEIASIVAYLTEVSTLTPGAGSTGTTAP